MIAVYPICNCFHDVGDSALCQSLADIAGFVVGRFRPFGAVRRVGERCFNGVQLRGFLFGVIVAAALFSESQALKTGCLVFVLTAALISFVNLPCAHYPCADRDAHAASSSHSNEVALAVPSCETMAAATSVEQVHLANHLPAVSDNAGISVCRVSNHAKNQARKVRMKKLKSHLKPCLPDVPAMPNVDGVHAPVRVSLYSEFYEQQVRIDTMPAWKLAAQCHAVRLIQRVVRGHFARVKVDLLKNMRHVMHLSPLMIDNAAPASCNKCIFTCVIAGMEKTRQEETLSEQICCICDKVQCQVCGLPGSFCTRETPPCYNENCQFCGLSYDQCWDAFICAHCSLLIQDCNCDVPLLCQTWGPCEDGCAHEFLLSVHWLNEDIADHTCWRCKAYLPHDGQTRCDARECVNEYREGEFFGVRFFHESCLNEVPNGVICHECLAQGYCISSGEDSEDLDGSEDNCELID